MVIGIPRETVDGENRVGVIPSTIKELIKHDFIVLIESNAGKGSFISDKEYESSGAKIVNDVKKLYSTSDIIVKVNHPISNTNENYPSN